MAEYSDDLGEFFDPDLTLKIRGTKYRIVSPNAQEGLRLRTLFASPDTQLDDATEIVEVMTLLGATKDEKTDVWSGGVWGEMEDAGLSWPEIFHAGRTALMHYGLSATLAQVQWHTGVGDLGNPMPPAPETESGASSPKPRKRAPAKKSTSRSPARTAKTTRAAGR